MITRNIFRVLRTAVVVCLALGNVHAMAEAEGFSKKTTPSLTADKAANMECRYFIELLTVSSPDRITGLLDPIANTEVDTVVCCPMGWRFYNFPSTVDTTWKEPKKHSRNLALFPSWEKMVNNLAAGGDPLRDALAATRKLKKTFIVSFRMNDSHYIQTEDFPTHNNFWRDHPEYRLGNDTKSLSASDSGPVFNYLVPEVRDFYFSVLEEICTKYDVDGVELDFQRAPRFFHDRELAKGTEVMTAHVQRIRAMLDRIGAQRGKHLQLGVRAMPTVKDNLKRGLDILAWDAAGWLDGIIVSSSYLHTTDVGIEEFVAKRKKAHIYGELNYVNLQLAGTGHDSQDRRYLTLETYRAATLSYLERGADGVSFFNTYCIPQPSRSKLTADLLTKYKDLEVLKHSDKNYTCYASKATMFGQIFPARNEKRFEMFIADEVPGGFKKAVLRFETKAACDDVHVEAWVNGTKLEELASDDLELFPPVTVNRAAPKRENLKFFTVPLSTMKFGINQIEVRKVDSGKKACVFVAAELGLYLAK